MVATEGTNFDNYSLRYQSINLVINKKGLEDSNKIKPKVISTHVYNTQKQTPTVEVIYEVDSTTSLTVPATAYTLIGDGYGTDAVNAKENYKVTVTAKENTNYTGSCDVYWNIEKAVVVIDVVAVTGFTTYNKTEQRLPVDEGTSAYTASISSVRNSTDAVKDISLTGKMTPDPTKCFASGTDAGDYYVSFEGVALNKNSFNCTDPNLSVESYVYDGGKFTINKKDINDDSITVSTTDHEYDAEEFSTSVVVKDGEHVVPTTNYTVEGTKSATHVDEYAITIVTNNAKNYKGSILTSKDGVDLKWNITPYAIAISNDDYTGVYTAKKHSTELTTTPISGKSDLLKTTFTTNGVNAGDYSGVGAGALQISANTIPGNATTKLSDFTITYGTAKMQITQKPLTVSLVDKVATYDAINTFAIDTVNYDGLLTDPVHTATATLANNSRKDAGETEVSVSGILIKDADGNNVTTNYSYNLADVKGKITVNKANFKITITGNIVSGEDYIYDGTEKQVIGYTATGDNQLFLAEAMPYVTPVSSDCFTKATDAGKYNLKLNNTEELTKDSFQVTDQCKNLNVSFKYNEGYLEISKKVLTISCNVSQNYREGKPISHVLVTEGDTKELSGLVGNEKVTGTLTTASKDIGVYDTYDESGTETIPPFFNSEITFDVSSGAKEANYEVQYNTVKMTIKDELIITVTGLHTDETNPVYYNGQIQHSPKNAEGKGYEVSASEPEGITFDPNKFKIKAEFVGCDDASGYNAGRYYMNLKSEYFEYTDPVYYSVVVVDGYLDISKKDITTCNISCSPNEFTYNALAQGPNIEIKNGETVLTERDYVVENAKGVDAGTYDIVIKGTGNYTGEITKEQNNKLTYTIKQANMTIQLNGNVETREYDGREHTLSGFSATEVTTSTGLLDQNKIKTKDNAEVNAIGTNYGQYFMYIGNKIDAGDFFSYDDANIIPIFVLGSDGFLNITQKDLSDIDVSVVPTEFDYDGQLHEPTVLVKNADKLLNYESDYVYSATSVSQATSAGLYTIEVVPAGTSNYKGSHSVE